MPALAESPFTEQELKREVARLRADFEARLAELERRCSISPAAPAQRSRPEPLTAEVVAIIAAAVTSFLGKKVKLHHARLLESGSSHWAQQGRAIIQASHNLVR